MSDMKESGLRCGSHAQLMCSILLDLVIYKMSKLKTSLHNNFSNDLFHMGRNVTFHAVLCSAPELCMLNWVLLDCNGTK